MATTLPGQLSWDEAVALLRRRGHDVRPGERLPQGLSNETWALTLDGTEAVARLSRGVQGTRLSPVEELRAMASAGSLAPNVLSTAPGLLVTQRQVQRGPPPPVPYGEALARLHRLPPPTIRTLDLGELLRSLPWTGPLAPLENRVHSSRLPPATRVLCHHDLTPENLVWTGTQLFFIDWEYAALADPAFDLTVALRHQPDAAARLALLTAYIDAGGPGRPSPAMAYADALLELNWHWTHRGVVDERTLAALLR